MKYFFKMKLNEWKIKAQLYGIIASFMDNQKDIAEFVTRMYTALKDVEPDELKEALISRLAGLAHEE